MKRIERINNTISKYKVQILLTIAACFIMLLIACVPSGGSGDVIAKDNSSGYGYTYIEIDGMACIKYRDYRKVALSCNWNEWDGKE